MNTANVEEKRSIQPMPAREPAGITCALGLAVLWMFYLAFPLHALKSFRFSFSGHEWPIYYLFTVLPVPVFAVWAVSMRRRWLLHEVLWGVFPCVLLGGVFLSGNSVWAFREWTSWVVRGFAVGGTFFLLISSRQLSYRVLSWVYVVAVAAAVFGLVEEFWLNYNPVVRALHVAPGISPMGTQGNRIPYTASLIPFLCLALWKIKNGTTWRWVDILCGVLFCSLILISRCRAAWVGAAVSLGLYSLLSFRESKIFVTGCVSMLIFLILGCLMIPRSRDLLVSRVHSFRLDEGSIGHRVASYRTLLALRNSWVLGVGYGRYPAVYSRYYKGPALDLATPDNQYLRWLIENGIFGFAALIGFFGFLTKAGFEKIKTMRDPAGVDFYRSIFCGWIGIATTFLFFDGFYWGACNMTFWSFLGLFATSIKSTGH